MRAERGKESNLHRIQESPLPELELGDQYEVERELGEGCFARIILANHRQTDTSVVLKMIHTELTTLKDFHREFHYSYHLSPHPNILCSYPVAFKAADCWVFAQEYAPLGDLSGVVRAGGVPENSCKKVARQLSSALEFMHSKQLVHRDIKLENILVFAPDLSTVKLCDFGETRKEDSSSPLHTPQTSHPVSGLSPRPASQLSTQSHTREVITCGSRVVSQAVVCSAAS
ncbi:serine/threonine-protein kinase meng-po-like [Homalodisca vitripennis]|uniref:serine/threonine-protein kinase meng-po-like n=1 Tax=Homalodisca vitripennis TaxID=197043 RepID=UPI001EEC7BC6|nr:serine/threonine-protein kinase meng-po-like [Homalodisca vitripennis]